MVLLGLWWSFGGPLVDLLGLRWSSLGLWWTVGGLWVRPLGLFVARLFPVPFWEHFFTENGTPWTDKTFNVHCTLFKISFWSKFGLTAFLIDF